MAIVIQAGHVNIGENCNEGLRGETGAPGEREYVAQVAAMVAGGLQANGHIVIVADANFNCTLDAQQNDYQAVVALHCDGRSTSGFSCNRGDPAQDGAAEASARLQAAIRSAYHDGNPELADLSGNFLSDQNISHYYLFEALTPKTPFVLLETGAIASADGTPGPDRDYLLSHTQQVAASIVNGVLAFLNPSKSSEPVAVLPEGTAQPSVPTQPAPTLPPTEPPAPDFPGPDIPVAVQPPKQTFEDIVSRSALKVQIEQKVTELQELVRRLP